MARTGLKILHVVESYYPHRSGMQEVVQQLSERIVRRGHTVDVATSKSSGRADIVNGVKIHEFNVSGNSVYGFRFGETLKYQQFLLDGEYDVVTFFAAQQWSFDLALPILGRIKGKKVFVPTGFSGLYWPDFQNYFAKLEDPIKSFDAVVCLSHDYRDTLFAKNNGASKISVIPNGSDIEEFARTPDQNVRAKYSIGKKSKIVLSVGSHTGVKGHSEMIDAFSIANLRNSSLVLIGNGNAGCRRSCHIKARLVNALPGLQFSRGKKRLLSSALKSFLKLTWLTNLFAQKKIFVLDCPRSEIISFYKQSRMFFFLSNIEASPVVIFEALTAGLPVLASDVGNITEIISWYGGRGKTIETCQVGGIFKVNVDRACTELERMLSNEDLFRRAQTENFTISSARFNWQSISQEYESLYLSLLED